MKSSIDPQIPLRKDGIGEMYSRSLDPRRVPTSLPSHYGGIAFRSDGTPASVPVKRDREIHGPIDAAPNDAPLESPVSDEVPPEPEYVPTVKNTGGDPPTDASGTQKQSEASPPFLSRLLGGILPGIREDDLLLLLLILLLSREEGNEDILLLLAFLLLAK